MKSREELIESILGKAEVSCDHWLTGAYDDVPFRNVHYKYGCPFDSTTVQSYLDTLRYDALECIDTQFDDVVNGCAGFYDFDVRLGELGLLHVEPELMQFDGKLFLRLRHDRYLHKFRNYAYQVSGDTYCIGDYGRSYLPMQTILEDLGEDYPLWVDFVNLAHATVAASGYREFRSLLQSRSQLVLGLIRAADGAVYDLVRWGLKNPKYAKAINVVGVRAGEVIAHLFVGANFICVRTNGAGSYFIDFPAEFEKSLVSKLKQVAAQFLLSFVGIVIGVGFRVDKKAKLSSMAKLDAPSAHNTELLCEFVERV